MPLAPPGEALKGQVAIASIRALRQSGPKVRAGALLMVALFCSTTLAGCLSLDFFLPDQSGEEELPQGMGLVRLWVAAKPGGLGGDFAHYNVTFGPSGHAQDIFVSQIVTMNGTGAVVDLLRLEREKQAAQIASILVPDGEYWGIQFQVVGARLGLKEVVGNDEGRPVERVVEREIKFNPAAGLIRYRHYAAAQSVIDLYLEIDVQRSLTEVDGAFHHATVVSGVSYFANGRKLGNERHDGGATTSPGLDPYGGGSDTSRFKPPLTRYFVYDGDDALVYDSWRTTYRGFRAIGLGEDLRFVADAKSRVLEQGAQVPIEELLWDFADGTSATGETARKNFTDGGAYDISLAARDAVGLVGRGIGTFFVPYRPDEAVAKERQTRSGTLVVGSAYGDSGSTLASAEASFRFPADLEEGDLRLGAYRIQVHFADPSEGLGAVVTEMRMAATSGHLDHTVQGVSPLVIETVGFPFWRPTLTPWVGPDLAVGLELVTGADVAYELTVEGLYFENMSRGHDAHAPHRHSEWLYGPDFRRIAIDGSVRPSEEDE